jgi:hypothetical protein
MLGVGTTLKIDEAGASATCACDSCCRELAADSAKTNKPILINFVIPSGPFRIFNVPLNFSVLAETVLLGKPVDCHRDERHRRPPVSQSC